MFQEARVHLLESLGIVVINSDGRSDGGLLFALALIAFVSSASVLIIHRREIPVIGSTLFSGGA